MRYLPIIAIAFFAIASCSKKITPTAEVTHLQTKDGVIMLRSVGYSPVAAKYDECIDEALKNAFKVLFERGIPGSQQNTALISTENKSEASHKFLTGFFMEEKYRSFVVSKNIVSDVKRVRKQKTVTVDVGINLTVLRKYLEQSNIIRKFGY